MGQFAISDESFTLEEQIKSLGDDELLDFWEETQHLTRLMAGDAPRVSCRSPAPSRTTPRPRSCRTPSTSG